MQKSDFWSIPHSKLIFENKNRILNSPILAIQTILKFKLIQNIIRKGAILR